MLIKDIFSSKIVKNLTDLLQSMPANVSLSIAKLFKLKSQEERIAFLQTLPEETVRHLLKVFTFLILSGGSSAKNAIQKVPLVPELKDFLDKVESEVKNVGEISYRTVSTAVDVVVGTATVVVIIGLVALITFLILNPPVAAALFTSTLVFEALIYWLSGIEERKKLNG